MIQCLLKAGKDPNEGYGGWQSPPPWTKFIQRTCQEEYKDDFWRAIETDLYLAFLHHGAARNARVELFRFAEPAVLDAMSCFIEMLFARHARHSDKALRVLEAFLDLSAGVDISDEVLITLFEGVGKLRPRATKPDRLRFYRKITEMVVNTGASLGWEMSFLLENIQKAFPGVLGVPILAVIGVRDDGQPVIVPPKRKAEKEGDLWERTLKRTKRTIEEGFGLQEPSCDGLLDQ